LGWLILQVDLERLGALAVVALSAVLAAVLPMLFDNRGEEDFDTTSVTVDEIIHSGHPTPSFLSMFEPDEPGFGQSPLLYEGREAM
jgi:hypothetical protein